MPCGSANESVIRPRHYDVFVSCGIASQGFVGNTILLTHPSPKKIMEALPPLDEEISQYVSVVSWACRARGCSSYKLLSGNVVVGYQPCISAGRTLWILLTRTAQ